MRTHDDREVLNYLETHYLKICFEKLYFFRFALTNCAKSLARRWLLKVRMQLWFGWLCRMMALLLRY